MTTLHDAQARERITHDVDTCLFVEAGAGSGKTHLLVARLITLVVERGVRLHSIAAITFTEKAAEELTARLRAAFTSIAEDGVHTTAVETREFPDPQLAQQRAHQALVDLPGAAIETLHAFCARIISMYPLEAHVPPIMSIADEFAGAKHERVLREKVSDAISAGLQGNFQAATLTGGKVSDREFSQALRVVCDAGQPASRFYSLAAWMDENWGELIPTLQAPLPVRVHFGVDDARVFARRLRTIVQSCVDHSDGLYPVVREFVAQVEAIVDATDNAASVSTLLGKPKLGSKGTKAAWPEFSSGKAVRDEIKALCEQWDQQVTASFHYPLAVIRSVLVHVVVDYARTRRHSGDLQFHDLIYIADDLVCTTPPVRAALHECFTHILVDEFQDTDPAQLRIVRAISGNGGAPLPGRLFTVGDPKQSIYRFRRADIDTYLSARSSGDADVVSLTTNFRSTRQVLSFVNATFGEWFAQVEEKITAVEDPALAPGVVPFEPLEAYSDNAHTAALRVGLGPGEGSTAARSKQEAYEVIDTIRAAVAGTWMKQTKKGTSAPIALKDIAILVRTHAAARTLMQHCAAAGIPFVAESSSLAYQAEEIVDLHTVIRAIAEPADQYALGAALRTVYLGISDADLAQWRMDGNHFYSHADNPDSPISEGIALIERLRKQAALMPVGDFIGFVCQQLLVAQVITARYANPVAALRRLNYIQAQAHYFTSSCHGSLREYVAWSDRQAEDVQRNNEPQPVDADLDAVKILTIHASKGREFPMVIVAGLQNRINTIPAQQGFHPSSGVVEYSCGGHMRTSGFSDVTAYDTTADEAEYARLFYVAATRAESVLVVCGQPPLKNPRVAGKPLWDACDQAGLDQVISPDEWDIPQDLRFDSGFEFPDTLDTTHREFVDRTDDHWFTGANLKRRHTPSELAHSGADSLLSAVESDHLASVGAALRENHDTNYGNALHELMEHCDPHADLVEAARAVALRYELATSAVQELVNDVETLLASPYIQEAFSSQHYRELPVFGQQELGGHMYVIDGVIDLMYRDGEKWVIADYKSDKAVSAQTVGAYLQQLRLYARVIEPLLDGDIDRLELLFPRQDRVEVRTEKWSQ
ncbi:UvrD-helicase domain-containing protein [Corynebacterium felinum]|uniref:DNA 3'-5' helicase n=1 Tax=Corynebacterium felinum TaxID=131318 RepID=A0ABU2B710_9CORY|nr:UvrD-helicase domain-containing protein [Corynebacterium felinum]MDF5820629.1 UvrD-helicase domain-containing protein [Corynebacterium felinum]MDR7353548.1 ATP-dependent exoDNAse (exonuclease V) beta subunit [Corynebacterium felinum]WJY95729.1 ATP-dependent helicase/nuclease subunit A [Corynebacterium felinum]